MTCAANTPERDGVAIVQPLAPHSTLIAHENLTTTAAPLQCVPTCHIFAFGATVCLCGQRSVAPFAPTLDAPADIDLATTEIARLNRTLRAVRELSSLSASDLLIRWRRFCIHTKRFGAPDWETGEAGMLRALLADALAVPVRSDPEKGP